MLLLMVAVHLSLTGFKQMTLGFFLEILGQALSYS